MNRTEQVDGLVEHFAAKLHEMRDEALREIREANERADVAVRRHGEMAEELAGLDARIDKLSAEKGRIPTEVTRADLDGDHGREDALRERYAEVGTELEALEERRDALLSESEDLAGPASPRFGRHPNDVPIKQYAGAAAVAHRHRAALELLQVDLERAVKEALDPVENAHRSALGAVQALSSDRDLHYREGGRRTVA